MRERLCARAGVLVVSLALLSFFLHSSRPNHRLPAIRGISPAAPRSYDAERSLTLSLFFLSARKRRRRTSF
ncbi:hypothetical protein BDZ88DRAFT_419803 [Geranomyces variabilis]|nr:hypothetical protein BDZ88DRAFT_419803 [Geranomyces variabilis]